MTVAWHLEQVESELGHSDASDLEVAKGILAELREALLAERNTKHVLMVAQGCALLSIADSLEELVRMQRKRK